MEKVDSALAAEALEAAGKGGKAPATKSHNNAADFARRYDAYKAVQKENAADLQEREDVAKAKHEEAMKKYDTDLSAFLRAKRFARVPGRVTFGGPSASTDIKAPTSRDSSKPGSASSNRPDADVRLRQLQHQASQLQYKEPVKPELVLPEFGGFPAYLQVRNVQLKFMTEMMF